MTLVTNSGAAVQESPARECQEKPFRQNINFSAAPRTKRLLQHAIVVNIDQNTGLPYGMMRA